MATNQKRVQDMQEHIHEARLTDLIEELLVTEKSELEKLHREKFPADHTQRGADTWTKSSLLIDLLIDLFQRTTKSTPVVNVYDAVAKLVENNSLHILSDAFEQGIIERIKQCKDEVQLKKLRTTRADLSRMSQRFAER